MCACGPRAPPPKKGIPIPEACEYVRLGDREIKVVDGIKVANQLTLRWGDYPGLPG